MRKNILGSVAIAAVAALSLASCNKSQPQVEAKSESKAPAELKIAYVEVDSIMTQYTFAKEYSSILEKKGQNIQATIAQKGQQLLKNSFRPTIESSSFAAGHPFHILSRCSCVRLWYGSKIGISNFAAFLTSKSLNQPIFSPLQQAIASS